MFGIATLEERLFTHSQESTPAEAAHLGDGRQRLTVLYRYLLSRLLENHCRTCKMAEVNHPHPAVFGIGYIDTIPAMVFVHWQGMIIVTLQGEILNTTLADDSPVLADNHLGPAPTALDAAGDRSIEGEHRAVDRQYLPMPPKVYIARMPCPIAHASPTSERGTGQRLYPLLGGRPPDDHSALRPDAGGGRRKGNADRACFHIRYRQRIFINNLARTFYI